MGNSLLFAAPEPSYHPLEYEGEFLWVPREETLYNPGHGIPCLLLQHADAAGLVIFFHANAEDLGMIYVLLRYMRTLLRVNVLAAEYAGYGVCSGTPSEEQVLADAECVLQFACDELKAPLDRTIVMGRSLGGGPAIYLASRHAVGGLVTFAAFSSISSLLGYTRAFVGWVVDIMDNVTRIRTVSCPTIIIHGKADKVVRVGQARALANACGADVQERSPVMLHLLDGVGHNYLNVKRDLVRPFEKVFPWLQDGWPVDLRTAAQPFLHDPSVFLSGDVSARVPYSARWVPHAPPWQRIKITGEDGDEI